MSEDNPLGREYTKAEWAAAKRLGIARDTKLWDGGTRRDGGLIWATGPYLPDKARKNARDWALVSAAIDREWNKEK